MSLEELGKIKTDSTNGRGNDVDTKFLDLRKEDRAQFVGSVLIAIFILGNALGLALWIAHLWRR